MATSRPRPVRAPVALVVLTALTGLVASGCLPSDGSGTPSSAAGPLPTTGWVAADRDQLADGGTLRLAVDALPPTYQLGSVDSRDSDDALVADLFLPAFVTLTADGGWTPDPDYAADVRLLSTDPQVVEVQINPAAVWSDGTPVTVADFAANWQALNGSDPDYAVTSTAVWQDVESVTAGTDERDVLIRFAQPNADWPVALMSLYPAWAVDTPERFAEAWRTGPFAADGTTYVSGGPFVVTSIDSRAGIVALGRNPAWWGQTPKLDTVVFTAVTRTSQGQAFANREIDVVNLNSDADTYRTAQARSDASVLRSQGAVARQITLNAQAPALSDVRVRRAFALSLDREVLAQAVLSGVDSPVLVQDSLLFAPGQPGYVDHMSPLLDGGVGTARQLLTAAGYDTTGDQATRDGQALTVRFVIPADVPASSAVAQLVAQQAARAGITVTIDAVPYEKFFEHLENRDFDLTYLGQVGQAFPVASSEPLFYPADSPMNLSGITDAALGDLWRTANAELDPDTRTDLANQIDRRLVALVTVIPLFSEPDAWGVTSTLRNYGPAQFQSVRWQDVGFAR
ncbi:MAG: ABC transporter family substrate-binding protein [Micrococcales bacterium]|nr:ABC transporter family substrate-binding protein [Micrococcales bacterium]